MASPTAREPGVDAARALAVVAMVFGHTADGLLSDAARSVGWVQSYWSLRGLTAPLFVFVSGWAVLTAIGRSPEQGMAIVRRRLPRVGLLFLIGFLLRWPGWDVDGLLHLRTEVWRHWLGFDALHCIAGSLLLALCVVAMAKSRKARALLLLALAVLVPLFSGHVAERVLAAEVPAFAKGPFVADVTSPFPLLPWAGYFFAGAVVGELLPTLRSKWARAAALVGVGGALLSVGLWHGVADAAQTSPFLFAFRIGQVMWVAAIAVALPFVASLRLAVVGRSSLVVYVFHLPVVYGWSTLAGLSARWGKTLSVFEVALTAAVLLGAGLCVRAGLIRLLRIARPARPRVRLAA